MVYGLFCLFFENNWSSVESDSFGGVKVTAIHWFSSVGVFESQFPLYDGWPDWVRVDYLFPIRRLKLDIDENQKTINENHQSPPEGQIVSR